MLLLNGSFILSVYYTSWSIYGRQFEVSHLPFQHLTHVNYAFATVDSTGNVALTDPWADIQRPIVQRRLPNQGPFLMGNLGALFEYKQKYPKLKVGLSIGGWCGSGGFSAAVSTAVTRATFVQTAVKMLIEYGLDYIDLDWEYPVSGGPAGQAHSINDGRNYMLLLQDFNESFSQLIKTNKWKGVERPRLSIALPCGHFTGRYDYLKEMGELVDFVNLMCYDFTGPTSPTADHHSNLFSRHLGLISADAGVRELLSAGFPSRKIVLGLPIYGRGFNGCNRLTEKFISPTAGTWGDPGVVDYKSLVQGKQCSIAIEPVTSGSYCQSHVDNHNSLYVFDSTDAVKEKVSYVKSLQLAGLMFWEASADGESPQTSLIQTAHSNFLSSQLDSSSGTLCYPHSSYFNINSHKNCTLKLNPSLEYKFEFVRKAIGPVDMDSVSKASSFGASSHKQQQQPERNE